MGRGVSNPTNLSCFNKKASPEKGEAFLLNRKTWGRRPQTPLVSVLQFGRHLAAVFRQLLHDLLVQPDIHRAGMTDIAGEA